MKVSKQPNGTYEATTPTGLKVVAESESRAVIEMKNLIQKTMEEDDLKRPFRIIR